MEPAACDYSNVKHPEPDHIERMFCRLRDFRDIATAYDKLVRNFLAGVAIAAAMI